MISVLLLYYKPLPFPLIMNLNLYHLDSALCHALALEFIVLGLFPRNSKKLPTVMTVVQSH